MPKPYEYVQFIDNNIYGSSYIVQPDIPAWVNADLAQQLDLVAYENDLFLTKQLLKRIYKEVFRISGEVIRENFKATLVQNWFWTQHKNLIELLKLYKTISDNTVTQGSLLLNVVNISLGGEQ